MGLSTTTPPSWRRIVTTAAIMPVVLVIVLSGLLGWLVSRALQAEHWVQHTQEVLRFSNRLEAHLNAMETGQRGFLLTGRPDFRRPYDEARGAIAPDLDRLEALVADNPTQQARVRALRPLVTAWLAASGEELRLRERQDPRLLTVFSAGEGARLMTGLRERLETFRVEERRLLAEREQQLHRQVTVSGLLGASAVTGALLFLGTIGRRQHRFTATLYHRLAQHSLLLEAAHDAILVRDAETDTITLWNQGAVHKYGYTPEEALGRSSVDLLATRFRTPLEDIRQTLERTGRWEGELLQQAKDGRELRMECRWTYYVAADGQRCVLENNHDVTEQRRAQLELDQIHREQLEDLQRADALKDQFIGILSHELRTPITAITGFGSLLEDELLGPLSETQRRYLRRMLATADNLLMLVNDLLDVSAMRAGRFTVDPAAIDPAPLLAEMLERLAPLAEMREQTLTSAFPTSLPLIWADHQRVAQVVTNLVGNAIKFTPKGGRITLEATAEPDGLRIAVHDTGPGITEGDQAKLFRPFSQLATESNAHQPGTGLGLSISRAIVEAHHGRIGIDSQAGQGATFWFILPYAPDPSI